MKKHEHYETAWRARHFKRDAAGKGAFSLIEVTLAIMVVSVGILSIMSLFSTGLDQNARSTEQTHTMLFAEEVMSSMRAKADCGWTNLDVNMTLPKSFTNIWFPRPKSIMVDGLVHTNMFYRQDYTNILQYSYRYRIHVTTNTFDTCKGVTLELWNSHYGAANISNAHLYYMEIFKTQQ